MKQRANPPGMTRKKSAKRSRSPKPWVLRDPETLRLVFEAFEHLTTLRQQCNRKVAAAREVEQLFGHLLWHEDESGFRRWSRLSEMVTASWSLLDQTVRTNRLDPAQSQEAYRQMLRVRMAWTRLESQPGPISLINQITDHLRQLLIRYAQAQAYR
jgi:hypothetical protein